MSYTDLNPKYGASFTAKSGQANPDDVLRQIMQETPGVSAADTWPEFKDEMLRDDDMVLACLRWYHTVAFHRIERLMTKGNRPDGNSKRARKAKKAEAKKRAEPAVEQTKRALILNHIMPNGKALRDCTFGYAKKIGSGYQAIASMGKPNQIIGEVLSDQQADEAMRR